MPQADKSAAPLATGKRQGSTQGDPSQEPGKPGAEKGPLTKASRSLPSVLQQAKQPCAKLGCLAWQALSLAVQALADLHAIWQWHAVHLSS